VILAAQWRQLVEQLRHNWTPQAKAQIDRARCIGCYTAEWKILELRHAAIARTRGAQWMKTPNG
jgi:hypothetical protein